MSNPHFQQTIDGLNTMHEVGQVTEAMSLGAIQAQATLALAYEQRTANLIAGLQPIRLSNGMEWLPTQETVETVRDIINERLQ